MLHGNASLISSLALALSLVACSAGSAASGSGENGNGNGNGTGDGDGNNGGNGGNGDGDTTIVVEDIPKAEPEVIPDCDNNLEIIVRDFTRMHPDFGGIDKASGGTPFIGDGVRRNLVKPSLDSNQKPIFNDVYGCAAPADKLTEPLGDPETMVGCANWSFNPEQAALTTAENFSEWYLDTEGVNQSFDKQLLLTDIGDGVYVYETDAFFPLGVDEGYGPVVGGQEGDGTIPNQNYLFTTEIHLQFEYVAGQKFTFRGDDDLWVFINGKLALDLGSMHSPEESTLDFDKQAADLGIAVGQSYPMDIFHAERRWDGSNFRIETNISCFIPRNDQIIR